MSARPCGGAITDDDEKGSEPIAGTGLKNCNDSIYRVVTTFI